MSKVSSILTNIVTNTQSLSLLADCRANDTLVKVVLFIKQMIICHLSGRDIHSHSLLQNAPDHIRRFTETVD